MNEWIIDGQYKIQATASEIFAWIKIEKLQNQRHLAECEELGTRYDVKSNTWINKSKI